jgi:hypothetical protein
MGKVEDLLEKSLTFKQRLPLKLIQLTTPPEEGEISSYEQANEALLMRLETRNSPVHEIDEDDMVHHELHRLEVKMDLILDLLTEVVSQSQILPASVPIEFNEYAIQLPPTAEIETDMNVRIDLYLDPAFPKPVILFARVYSVEPFRLEIQHVSEVITDLLSRYIFRQHRRQIAKERSE